MRILLILCLFISCSTFQTKEPNYKDLDQYFTLLTEHKKAMGSVLLLEEGEVKYSKHYHFKDEVDEPIYRIGSISKTYTAVLILKLVEEGKLTLETKLSRYFPKIDQANKITIDHLLRHRSGLPNFTNRKDYLDFSVQAISRKKAVKGYRKYKLEFKPGSKYSYSNTGYVLLSYILEDVSGLSYEQALAKYITTPLNFNHTFVFKQKSPRKNEVKSFSKSRKWKEERITHESVALGAGAIASTPKEVALFLRALFKGKLIKEESLKKMEDLQDGYGHALISFPYDGRRFLGHTGGIDGFLTIAGYNKEDDLVMIQFSNAMSIVFNHVSIALLSAHYDGKVKLPVFKKEIHLSKTILNKYKGTYSGKNFPLKLTFWNKDGVLFGIASGPGQGELAFLTDSETEFSFPRAKVKLKFSQNGKELEFTQGKTFKLRRE